MMGFHQGNETLVTVTETFFKEILTKLKPVVEDTLDIVVLFFYSVLVTASATAY